MRTHTHKFLGLIAALFLTLHAQAQMSGTYGVPGSFTSIAAAINSLNAVGVSGPVIINVQAGYTETAPVGGYNLSASGTSVNTITFQKFGAGANPLITAYTGTATPASAAQDGVWRLLGSDYITIDGFSIVDPNTSNPATMEFGIGIFKSSATNGAQFNTIRNCNITLNRINNVTGSGPATDGSRGIDLVNATSSAHTTNLTITSAAGASINNKIFSNTIDNCNIGVALIGFAAPSTFTLADFGNDVGGPGLGNNIINFGGGGTNPAAAIRTLNQYSISLSFNVINNNTGTGVNHTGIIRGIYHNTATSATASINNNTLTINFGGTTSQVSVIENAAGATAATNTININNNLIVNCTNPLATSSTFYGIFNNAASCTNLNISGNTFSNNITNATTGGINLIANTGSVPGIINISNNTLSHRFAGATAYSGTFYGINNTGGTTAATLNVNSNLFTGFVYTGLTGTGTFYYLSNTFGVNANNISGNAWTGISLNHSGPEYFINNNSSTQAVLNVLNNAVNGYTRTAASGDMYLYYSNGSSTGTSSQTFTGNVFSNITSTVAGAGIFYGIYNSDGLSTPYPRKTISTNTVSNITYNSSGTFYGFYSSYLGHGSLTSGSQIFNNLVTNIVFGTGTPNGFAFGTVSSTTYSSSVFSNTISQITSSGAATNVYGVNLNAGLGLNFYKNRVYNITSLGATGLAHGIFVSGGTNINIYNNLVGAISSPSSAAANAVTGINISGGTNVRLYYNSVYLNAVSSGLNFGSSALFASSTPSLDVRNNIFVNASTSTGTGLTAAYRRSSTNVATYLSSSNRNLFYAGIPGTSNLIYTDGTNQAQTLSAYQSLVGPADGLAVTENPPFLSTLGQVINFLNINYAVPTLAESNALPVAGITDDFIGTLRDVNTPDIGAWEGINIPIPGDVSAPVVSGLGFTSPACNLTNRSFTLSITDASGVATGSLSPQVYYKVNAGTYTSSTGTLASGSATNGVWSFTMNFTANALDIISYYVVAQDIATTPNVGSLPVAGFSATSVNTVITAPTTPGTYTVAASLSGSYNIGVGGTYTTLTQAALNYNASCLAGPVTFVLTDAVYSTNETFPVVFANNPFANSTNSLLIVPASGTAVAINGAAASTGLIKFFNAQYITIDGSNAGGSITLNNNNTGTSASVWLTSPSGTVGPGNNNITVKNLNIVGGSNTATGSYGILAGVDGASPSTTGGYNNDNISILTNTIVRVYHGIYTNGSAATSTAGATDNLVINANNIGPVATGTGNIGGSAIFAANAVNLTISNNRLRNFTQTSGSLGGIYLSSNINTLSVTQNTISDFKNSSSSSGVNAVSGLFFGGAVLNSTVTGNSIYSIENTSASGYGARGIIINTGTSSSNMLITNNFISDIYSYSDASAIYWPIGIAIEGSSGGVTLDFNSVSLFGTHPGLSSCGSTALYLNSSGTGMNIRNNIFSNTYDNSVSTTETSYALYSNVTTTTNYTSFNYNDYYVGGLAPNQILGYISSNRTNIAAIQVGFGQNANSQNLAVPFTSGTDLHVVLASASAIDNLGGALPSPTIDIDGQVRSATTPDFGADEFNTNPCTTPVAGTVTSASYSACTSPTQNFTLTAGGASGGYTTLYQWQVATGTTVANATGSGSTTTTYNTGTLAPGSYTFSLINSCGNSSLSATSNSVVIDVYQSPTSSVSISAASVCSGSSLSFTAGTDIGTNYTWTGPAGFSSSLQSPSIPSALVNANGIYTLIVSTANCSAPVRTIAATVSAAPNAVTVTPATPSICLGTSVTFTATGGGIPRAYQAGTGVGVNTSSTYPAPYSAFYGGQRMQFLVLASELTAAGFVANSQLTNIQFPVVSLGSNWGSSITNNQNFRVSIGATALTSLTGFQTGLTSVVAPASFTPAVGYGNTHNFSAPFVWNGTSNIILETSFSNSITGAAANSVIQNNTNTTFSSTVVYFVDNTDATTVSTATTVSLVTTARPDFIINGVTLGTYTWSPAAGLSSSVVASPVATPSVSNVYTVTRSNTCGTVSAAATLSVIGLPVLSLDAPSATLACAGASVTISANAGASTYTWNPGGLVGATVVVTPTANTTYTAIGTDAVTGCNSSATVAAARVTITAGPTPTISVPVPSFACSGFTTNLTASGASTYTWDTGATTSTLAVSPVATTVYTVIGRSAIGCTGTATQTLNVVPGITVALSQGTNNLCAGQTVTLGASGGISYLWSPGGATSASITVTPTDGATYTVVGSAGACTSAATSASMSVLPIPTITVLGPVAGGVCPGQSAVLIASGAASYTWDANAGGANTTSVTVTPTINTTYTVTGSNTLGCSSSRTFATTIYTVPLIGVAQSASSVCVSGSVTSSTLTASGAFSYSWSVGAPNASVVVVNPTTTSVYTVSGVTSVNGCVSTRTIAVGVYPVPSLTIAPASATVCSFATANFTASGASTYVWNGSIAGNTASFVPAVSSVYTVVGTDAFGCLGTNTVALQADPLPTVGIFPSSATVCALSGASFVATGATTYTWNNNGVFQGANVTLYQSGNTTHSVVGTNSFGCSSSATVGVSINPLPVLVLTPATASICSGSSATLSVAGANTYSWSTASTAAQIVVNPTVTTSYMVTGVDLLGCVTSSAVVVVTNTLPVISVAASSNSVCPSTSVGLTASGAGVYYWVNGPNSATAVFNPSANSVYTVVGIDAYNGCVNSQTAAITTYSAPLINIAAPAGTICLGTTATLTASGAPNFTWAVTGENTNTIEVTPTVVTVYTVSGTSSDGCVSNKTLSLDVFELPDVQSTPTVQTICLDGSVASFTASGASTYTWTGNVTTTVFTVQPTTITFYTLTGTDANNCTNYTTLLVQTSGCVGLKENNGAASLITVFPNPSEGLITAKFEFEGNKQIIVTDGLGRIVELRVSENQIEEFDLRGLAKGVYYVKVNSKTASANFKISVQ